MKKKKRSHNLPKAERPKEEIKILRIWRHLLFAPGLIILLALCLRLPNFTASLWYDEVWHTYVGLQGSNFTQVLFHDVHPPLYPLFMRGWIALFGDGEISMRTPSLLFGLASIGMTYALAKNWFDQPVAILSALLMALSPSHIWYSQEAKNNMLLLLLTLLALWGLQQAWKTNRRSYWHLFILATIFSLWTNHFALWALAAVLSWLWLQMLTVNGRSRFYWIAVSTAVILLAYVPGLVMLLQNESLERGYLRPFTPLEIYNLFLIYLSHGNTLRTVFPWNIAKSIQSQAPALFLLEIFFLLLLLRGAWSIGWSWWMRLKEKKESSAISGAGSELLLFCLVAPPVMLLAASVLRPHIYVERSMIFLLPPYLIVLAYGALSFQRSNWRAVTAGMLLLLALTSLCNLWGPKAEAWTVWMPKPDWRATTSYFDREIGASAEKFLIFQVNPETSLVYYYDRIIRSANAGLPVSHPTTLPIIYLKKFTREEIDGYLASTGIRKVYFVHNHQWSGAFPLVMRAVQSDPQFRLTDAARFPGITVYRFAVP